MEALGVRLLLLDAFRNCRVCIYSFKSCGSVLDGLFVWSVNAICQGLSGGLLECFLN